MYHYILYSLSIDSSVTLGTSACSGVNVTDSLRLTCTTSAATSLSTSSVNVYVVSAGVTSSVATYTYDAALTPILGGLSPTSGSFTSLSVTVSLLSCIIVVIILIFEF